MKSKKKPSKKTLSKQKPSRQSAPRNAVSAEEKILFNKVKRGNEAARNELLKRYSVWATNIARKYHALFPNIEVSELEAEGNRGLLEAIVRFDQAKNTKFSTYSWFWIIKNMQEYITSSINLIDVPAKVMSDLKMIINAMNNEIKKGKTPSLKDISSKLGLKEDEVHEMLSDKKNTSTPLSLDMFMDEEDRQEKFVDMLEDKKLESVKKILDRMEDKKFIVRLFEQLSPLEQKVISMRFGFKSGKTLTLSEVGQALKITPLKVKDIEAIVLIKLRRLANTFHDEHEQALRDKA